MKLFDELAKHFKSDPNAPVHMNVVATITSPNDQTSPMTGTKVALAVVHLLQEISAQNRATKADALLEAGYKRVGVAAYGPAMLTATSAAGGRELLVPVYAAEMTSKPALDVAPRDLSALLVDARMPSPLDTIAAHLGSEHLLYYRETFFRTGDTVRIEAMFAPAVPVAAGEGLPKQLIARPELAPILVHERA